MQILVNGMAMTIQATRLDAMLDELGYAGRRVATALDGDFVPAARRAEHALREHCRVEIVAPMPGG